MYVGRTAEAPADISHSFGRSTVAASVMFLGQKDKANRSPTVTQCPERDRRRWVRAGPASIRRFRKHLLRRASWRIDRLAFGGIAASRSAQETRSLYPKEFAPRFRSRTRVKFRCRLMSRQLQDLRQLMNLYLRNEFTFAPRKRLFFRGFLA